MKNKPLRHKESNTFKFKPFSERITEIDVDVFHRVSHRNEEESDQVETHFHNCLKKWNVLNLTENYTSFKNEVRDIATLPQLLNSKEKVVSLLLKHIEIKDVLSLQPILELSVAVARDLQKEFYDYFPKFLSAIINLLNTNDAEQLEYALTTLAYLFKFLWRYLIKNIESVFDLLLPLLAESKPAYINNFAAESFSFVVRKVKDKKAFLLSLLKVLSKRPDGVSGCGKLLFEVIKGTPGQFHSCADEILSLYFGSLEEENIDRQLLYSVIKQVLECILDSINPARCEIFWKVILRFMHRLTDRFRKDDIDPLEVDNKKKALFLLQSLVLLSVEFREGRMLADPNPLIDYIVDTLNLFKSYSTIEDENDKTIVETLGKITAGVLLASNVKLTQENSNKLVSKVLSIPDKKILRSVVEDLINYSSFETLILPRVIDHSFDNSFDGDTLRLFTKIIKEKSPPCLNGIRLKEWTVYNLNFKNITNDCLDYLITEFDTLKEENCSQDALRILILLPHLNISTDILKKNLLESTVSIYETIVKYDYDNITETEREKEFNKLGFKFLLAMEALVHILKADKFHDFIVTRNINLFKLIEDNKKSRTILSVVDLCLTHISESSYKNNFINEESFNSLNEILPPLFGSPYSKDRLLVSHIYSLYANLESLFRSEIDADKNPLELAYLAEVESATVQTYRDKLLKLQNFQFESQSLSNLDFKNKEFSLYYLLGNLYINFSLLWDPTMKLIASYANKRCEYFWPIFMTKLKLGDKIFSDFEIGKFPRFDCDVNSELVNEIFENDDKPDFNNYNILIWKCMSMFTDYCETKNRHLTGIFIDFVETNFFKSNSEDAKIWSIKKYDDKFTKIDKKERKEEEEVEDEEEEDEDEDDSNIEKISKPDKPLFDGKNKIKLLISQMDIFSKIKNPRTLYRESEMYKIYLELLSSKNSEIQKSALNCILSYKHKYILPYKDHLLNLIDDKSLKNELALFKIDRESKMIEEDHRDGLLPIIMRIIYSKMVSKTGMRTGGKAGGLVRRTIVLRFLSGIKEDEMMIFVDMAFKIFQNYVPINTDDDIDVMGMVENVLNDLDLTNIIPPKRLQSSVNLLSIIIEEFGGNMSKILLPRLLAILFCVLAKLKGISLRSNEVHPGYSSSIKNLRSTCLNILSRFFNHFENYPWEENEIDAMFSVAVFPWIEKLPIEGIHSPTALLKLFIAWSQNPRYWPLFSKYRRGDPSIAVLPYVIKLIEGPKTHGSVVNAIMEMIERMLTLKDYGVNDGEEDDRKSLMDVDRENFLPLILKNNVLEVVNSEANDRSGNNVNYGSTLLLPHVQKILEFIKKKLNSNSKKGLNRLDLVVLSRVSEFIVDKETCDTLLTLLIPILVKKASRNAPEEVIVQLISTIVNLMKIVEKPEKHLRLIVPLVGVINGVHARKLLIKLSEIMSRNVAAENNRDIFIENSKLLTELNAWDSKWIDQPDFDRRLKAFKQVDSLFEEDKLLIEFGAAVIYNCFYFLKYDKDLAIRDISGQCLKTLAPKLVQKYKESHKDKHYLIDDTILKIVRTGIRDNKNEVVRNQSIGLLGELAMECPDSHPVLRDLNPLTNKNDPEVDVFENLQHLQLHRKVRALLKFCTISKTLVRSPNPKTLTQFVLPLASSYLCSDNFLNKNSIVDAAIETVGTVCRLLPWHQYEVVLKYYLDKLRTSTEYQKQTIRIVVAIIDAFHYNLSKLEYKNTDDIISTVSTTTKTIEKDSKEEEENENEKEKEIHQLDDDENLANYQDEKLDQALDDDLKNFDDTCDDDKNLKNSVVEIPVMQRELTLSQSAAKRLIFSISKGLLPQLNRAIMSRTNHENSHKVNRKRTGFEREEEEIMRVPIALAVVKLLQKLPENVLEQNLPGILMKLCTFLKSRLDSVRRVTRETMQKIIITLGPNYLHHLLKEMNSLLTKGFQIHVLVYTIHAVLVSLKPFFKPLDMNKNLQSILSVCKVDLFGQTGEEKEVSGIVKNTSEAKSTKSFDIFNILAEFITESCLLDLIMPLKEVLLRSTSYKIIRKSVECLRQIVLGLANNNFIETDKMLIFLYGVVSESIPSLLPKKISDSEKKINEREAQIKDRWKQDCLIVLPEPKSRTGAKPKAKTSFDTNAHVMIEFALKLYHILLKRDRIRDQKYKIYIDPLVSVLSDCLKSQHVKLTTLALQCLNWVLKMDSLSSLESNVSDICSSIFKILHKYGAAGLSKGDNYDLVMASFKCMSVIVRDLKNFKITDEQLKILIIYAEQDLHDSDRQGTAFALLRAIISRNLILNEIHGVMDKVAKLSVTSELDNVRQQARALFHSFIMEYPMGKKLDKHLSFYLSQLDYELKTGRKSALEMLHGIITGFPLTTLAQHSGLFFLMIGARLVNDDDPECRKLCAKCIKEMIIRLPHNHRNRLFDIIILWLKDSKISHRRLAAQLCGIFVTVEKGEFQSHLEELLPLVVQQFNDEDPADKGPGRFVRIKKSRDNDLNKVVSNFGKDIEDPERMKDHHLFQVLQMLLKLSSNCPEFLKDEKYRETVSILAAYSQSLLAYPHLWVRLASAQFIGFILSSIDIEKLSEIMRDPEKLSADEKGYIYSDPIPTVKSLALDLAAQLKPDQYFEDLADQVVKNLVFIARVVDKVPSSFNYYNKIDSKESDESNDNESISLMWLVKRMRKIVNVEVTQYQKSTAMRNAVFKWLAGIVATIPIGNLKPILFHIMSPLVREMATIEESNAPLRHLAKDVATMIKKSLGNEEYAKLLSKVQQKLDTRRAEKKKLRTQEFITDPELAAKRKIAKQQKKKESKKRKMETMKGRKSFNKKPRKEVNFDNF